MQRKRHRIAMKIKRSAKRKEEEAQYQKLLTLYTKEKMAEKLARRRSSASHRDSESTRHNRSSK